MPAASPRKIAIACQGGGSHTAFTAGALTGVLAHLFDHAPSDFHIVGVSGTSGGAICATLAWAALCAEPDRRDIAIEALERFWLEPFPMGNAAITPGDYLFNQWLVRAVGLPLKLTVSPYVAEAFLGLMPWIRGSELNTWVDAKAALRNLLVNHIDFAQAKADQARLGANAPELFIGAAAVKSGRFTAFKGSDPAFGPEAVLASACLPEFMTAQSVPGTRAGEPPGEVFWDGLFSQNPPLTPFLDAPRDQRPDEIWIIRINPVTRAQEPTAEKDIADRRNELAGNLSLGQEIDGIERINKIAHALATARAAAPDANAFDALPGMARLLDYKQVVIRDDDSGIKMSAGLADELDYGSKLRRDEGFLERLFDDGRDQAKAFLASL